jgi:teichuronic acid biosynthesis glycosyltransferase TuaG
MIAVIMPVYNGDKYIAIAINAVLSQTYQDLRLFVIDDGSIDNTNQVLKNIFDPRLQCHTKENEGAAKARNFGLQQVLKDHNEFTHIAFCDADDIWYENKLDTQLADMTRTGCKLSYTNGQIIDEDGKVEKKKIGYFHKYDGLPRLLLQNHIPTSSVLIRCSENFDGADLCFDTKLVGTEDWDLWIRLAKKETWLGINECLFAYRRTTGSLSSFSLQYHFNNFLVLIKHRETLEVYGDKLTIKCYIRLLSKFLLQLLKFYLSRSTATRTYLLIMSPFYLGHAMVSQIISRLR